MEEIEQRITRVKRLQSTNIVERLHRSSTRTSGSKGYEPSLRPRSDADRLEDYLACYNQSRLHQGCDMNGKTPALAFVQGLPKPQPQNGEQQPEKRTTKYAA